MELPSYFISCDWGTTNFRLCLVETNNLNVTHEIKTNQGIKTLFNKFLNQDTYNQRDFFSNYLKEQVQELPKQYRDCLIVASGMTSANIGLYELPYGGFPFSEDGKSLEWEFVRFDNGLQVLVISGVKSVDGLIRGEEVQAIGLGEKLRSYNQGVLILPGTHCKHIGYRKGSFVSLKNFMTGELFNLISEQSILSNSVAKDTFEIKYQEAFLNGVSSGASGKLNTSLLSIRTKHLIDNKDKVSNYFELSGILIGDELSYLKGQKSPVFLAAPEPISHLYKTALEFILNKNFICFNNDDIKNALVIGQLKILEYYARK